MRKKSLSKNPEKIIKEDYSNIWRMTSSTKEEKERKNKSTNFYSKPLKNSDTRPSHQHNKNPNP